MALATYNEKSGAVENQWGIFSRIKKGRLSLGTENEFLKAIASVALPTPMSDYFTVVGVEQIEIHISQAYNNFPQKNNLFVFFG